MFRRISLISSICLLAGFLALILTPFVYATEYPWSDSDESYEYDTVYWQDPQEQKFDIDWRSVVPVLPVRSFGANFVREDIYTVSVYPNNRHYGYNYYMSKEFQGGVSFPFLQERFPGLVLPSVASNPSSLIPERLWFGIVIYERGTGQYYLTLHSISRANALYDGVVVRVGLGYNAGSVHPPFDFSGFQGSPFVGVYGYNSTAWTGSENLFLQSYTDNLVGLTLQQGSISSTPSPAFGLKQIAYSESSLDKGIIPLWVGVIDPLSTEIPDVTLRADYPWGQDPVPIEFGEDILPNGNVLNWEYLRQFQYVPKYEDMLRLVSSFSPDKVGADYSSQMYYLIARDKSSGRYEVTIFGDKVPAGKSPGILLRCSKKFAGIIGYNCYTPEYINVISNQRLSAYSDWSLGYKQTNINARAPGFYPPRVWYKQEKDIVAFGIFDPGDTTVVVPEPIVPSPTPEQPYNPGDEDTVVNDDYGFWGQLFRDLFVPRRIDTLPLVRLFGGSIEPVLDMLSVFNKEITPGLPALEYRGVSMTAGIKNLFSTPVSAFGFSGTLQSIIQTLGGISLTVVMLRAMIRLAKKVVGG